MAKLGAEQGVQDLRALAAQTAGPVRDELQIKIDALEVQVKHWREQAEALDTAQRRAESERQTEIIKIELAERRSRLWRSFLERQSVATMLGALLLILMFLFIAIAAGSGAKVPELVSNAFLVILGYFFGQGGSSSSRNGDSPDARGA
jgi:VIT1/CCC1 family predicted Fe2+/Mn2+ transporter